MQPDEPAIYDKIMKHHPRAKWVKQSYYLKNPELLKEGRLRKLDPEMDYFEKKDAKALDDDHTMDPTKLHYNLDDWDVTLDQRFYRIAEGSRNDATLLFYALSTGSTHKFLSHALNIGMKEVFRNVNIASLVARAFQNVAPTDSFK